MAPPLNAARLLEKLRTLGDIHNPDGALAEDMVGASAAAAITELISWWKPALEEGLDPSFILIDLEDLAIALTGYRANVQDMLQQERNRRPARGK